MSDSDVELARRAIALLDLTDLTDDASPAGIDRLCDRAARNGTAAVCVWPDFVAQSVAALIGTPVRVATVVNFPSGDERPHAVRVLTEQRPRRRRRRDRRRAAVSGVAGRQRTARRRCDRRRQSRRG